MFISFLLYLAGKRKETNQRKENRRLSKETVKCFISNFSATSCCKNYLKTQLFLTKVPSGLRPEPPTAYKVSRYCFLLSCLNKMRFSIINIIKPNFKPILKPSANQQANLKPVTEIFYHFLLLLKNQLL